MQWRQQNDWIHRNSTTKQLLMPLEGIRYCGQRNIRPKHCSGTAEAVVDHFDSENLPYLIQMKQIQPNGDVFQKVSTFDINVDFVFARRRIYWVISNL